MIERYDNTTPQELGWFIQPPDVVLPALDNEAFWGRVVTLVPTVPDNVVLLIAFPVRTPEVVYRESYVVRHGARGPPELALCA